MIPTENFFKERGMRKTSSFVQFNATSIFQMKFVQIVCGRQRSSLPASPPEQDAT